MEQILQTMQLFLTVEQVASRFGVSTDTIWRWKRNGAFPKAVRVGPGTTRWRLADIEEHERRLQCCFETSL
ncbi:MAG: AlpA family phage regulatory protein [Candidatus Hydrogenedentes bacterium]|nr:AlpA family phage regulatory protein [Candidatus Hydrogenedentota bacterium]